MSTPSITIGPNVARLLAHPSVIRGKCLTYIVMTTLNGKPSLDPALTALAEWDQTPSSKRFSGAGPKGAPVYFSNSPGDVALSMGDGKNCATIDPNRRWGEVGIQTIASRAQQIGGRFLGHTMWLSGYNLVTPTQLASTGSVTKATEKLMAGTTGKASFYDATTGIRYIVDFLHAPDEAGVTVIGTKSSSESVLLPKSSTVTKTVHTHVEAICSRHGVNPIPSGVLAVVKPVKGAILGPIGPQK